MSKKKRKRGSLPPEQPPSFEVEVEVLAAEPTAVTAIPDELDLAESLDTIPPAPPAARHESSSTVGGSDVASALAELLARDEHLMAGAAPGAPSSAPRVDPAAEAAAPEVAPAEPLVMPARRCHVLAIGGGKGGVGKSVLASNLAIYLASIGRRVVLVDADRDGGNLHTLVASPTCGEPGRSRTAVPGLELEALGLDGRRTRPTRVREAVLRLREERFDYIVIDLGVLAQREAMDAFLEADRGILVTLPEPTALEGTYRFLSRSFLRRVLARLPPGEGRDAVREAAKRLGGSPTPLDLWRALDDDALPVADRVREELESYRPAIVLNETRLRADLDVGDALRTVVRRRLGLTIEYLGHIEHDDTVWSAVRARKLLLIESPGTKAAKNVEKLARRLLALESGKAPPAQRSVPAESHHDLLEVERGATEEEVRRAHKRMREIFADDSLVTYSLFTDAQRAHVRERIAEAFDVLLDPQRRRPYELSIFADAEGAPVRREARDVEDEPLPPAPELTPDTDYTGALLRAVRLSRGIRIEEISDKTRVRVAYLAAIESDDFGSLPAAVYVRGFVAELAKYLRLDVTQVSRTYVRRYRRFLEERSHGQGAS